MPTILLAIGALITYEVYMIFCIYVDDEDLCVSEPVKFGHHLVIDSIGLFFNMHINYSVKCL